MTVICVDLSHYQTGFDMQAFKNAGGLGVILKATESTGVIDNAYATHRSNAKAAGLAVASYHFFRSTDPATQAEFYLSVAQPEQGERVVLDLEDSSVPVGSGITFLKHIASLRPDLQLTVYTGNVGEEREKQYGRDEWLAANTSLWTAQYSSSPSPWASKNWPQWSLWQYTDQGKVAGFNGSVDCNKFNGSDANFLLWMGPAKQPAPAPGPEISTIDMQILGSVIVLINGETVYDSS